MPALDEEERMKAESYLRALKEREILVRPAGELSDLIEAAELLREEETHFAGRIRVLRVDDRILVQEQEPKSKKLVIRAFPSEKEAERFVDDRLSTYDRMWDGCGCKIDYYK
jgi:hypothetical protein